MELQMLPNAHSSFYIKKAVGPMHFACYFFFYQTQQKREWMFQMFTTFWSIDVDKYI